MPDLRTRLLSLALAASLLVAACTGAPPPPSPVTAVAPTTTPATGSTASTPVASPTVAQPTASPAAPSPTAPSAAAPPATPTSPPSAAASPTAAAAVGADPTFSGRAAYAHVQALAGTIGSRPAGSKSIDAARDYIADQLAAFGYRVEKAPFTFSEMVDRGTELAVVQPSAKKLDPAPLYNTASGEVTAEVIDVGLGRQQDFPTGARGKIVLVDRGVMIFQEKVDNAAAAGAAAVIIANNRSGNFRGEVRQRPPIPAVSISQEDGQAIRDLMAKGPVRLHLKVDVEAVERTAYNVIATKPGPADRVVVIGGHYDSVEAGPGANDNASGTATVLELARTTAGRPYPFSIRFMLFSAEELGLLGSRAVVRNLPDADRQAIVAMINLDMVGVGDALRIGGSDELEQLTLDLAKEEGIPAGRLGQSLRNASDHAAFAAAGIPAVFFYRVEDPNYHTADDKPEYVKPEHLAVAGNLVLRLLDQLAQP